MLIPKRLRIHRFFLFLGLLVVGWSATSALDPGPIRNWTAPTNWSPPSEAARTTDRTALTLLNSPLPFIPILPCRLADTRGNGFTGGYGPPSMPGAHVQRTFTIGGRCGIPVSAPAVSFNFAVWAPVTRGDLRVFPAGFLTPTVSTLNWEANIQSLSNAAVVALGTGGAITVQVDGPGTIDLIIDVNGYYDYVVSSVGYPFYMSGNSVSGGVIVGSNNVGPGVRGFGLLGSALGASGSLNGSAGVFGNVSDRAQAYGVKGKAGSIVEFNGYPTGSWGVVGVGGDGGVWGQADPAKSFGYGVMGESITSVSQEVAGGILGYKNGTTYYGVFSMGNFGGTGAKFFVEPHPSDADKVIRYVALEGPEAGTYFRGTSRTAGKKAVIEVPESFRIVTDEEGLTVQLTPVGELAILAVVEQDLNRIVVRSSADVSFHYQVNGVRRSHKTHEAIADGSEFRPLSSRSRMPSYLSEEARKRLVENGTYNQDGSVNLGTARRLGWTRVWEEERRQRIADQKP